MSDMNTLLTNTVLPARLQEGRFINKNTYAELALRETGVQPNAGSAGDSETDSDEGGSERGGELTSHNKQPTDETPALLFLKINRL